LMNNLAGPKKLLLKLLHFYTLARTASIADSTLIAIL